jgi:peptidoglycan hydrolase CwlO-like protein
MNDKTTLQNHLESFKSQMKEVNESLYKFESEFKKEKAKIEQLRHSFYIVVKLINHELIKSMDDANFILSKLKK